MKLSLRLLLGYFLIVAVAGYFVLTLFLQEVKPGVRQAMEDTLIDTASLLASIAAKDMQEGRIKTGRIAQAFSNISQQNRETSSSGISKESVEYRVYITDIKGKVIFDSTNEAVGQDYSRWNDVYLTLRGEYGARSTRQVANDESSSVMYVAAPVKQDGVIIGSLTVAKPNSVMAPVIHRSEQRILLAGAILLGIALAIGLIFVWWINKDIQKLMYYADDVTKGKSVNLPKMGAPELAQLAHALQEMRLKLEGKDYVENYIHALTHELKSPLAAIRGAVELLQENPPPTSSQRFLSNIEQQNHRMQKLIDRMLLLAKVESRSRVEFATLDVAELICVTLEEKKTQFQQAQIDLKLEIDRPCLIYGDGLLISQAVTNLLDNALDFTAEKGEIAIRGRATDTEYELHVINNGEAIPDYALDKIFERFYSLPRPKGEKSSGLGLSFVREVALLHHGNIEVKNHCPKGVQARLTLSRHTLPS